MPLLGLWDRIFVTKQHHKKARNNLTYPRKIKHLHRMKRDLKNALLALPGFQQLCRSLTRRHVRTFMFHRFTKEPGGDSRLLSADLLSEQMNYLTRHHPNWTPDDHAAALHGVKRWQACPVVITVDDGYRDFYEVAFPILRDHGVRPVLFVTTNFVEGKILLWWDRLRQILTGTSRDTLYVELQGESVHLPLTTPEKRDRAWNIIADYSRFVPDHEREALLDHIGELCTKEGVDTGDPRFQAVTWDQVMTMARAGVIMGAHTVNHPVLSRLPPEQAKKEIVQSKLRLEAVLGYQVDWFSYPQGGPADYTEANREIVHEAGFTGSYVAYQSLGETDIFRLPRYGGDNDLTSFKWKLCGAEYLMLRMRKAIGKPASYGDTSWQDVYNRALAHDSNHWSRGML